METLLRRFVARSKTILRENLVGIYLHGSAVMGCFNPSKSDIDLLVVVNDPIPDAVKKAYMDMVVELNAYAPAKGIEMSIVTRDVCSPFLYPTPFELHFSVAHMNWYRNDPEDYVRKMKGTDIDLAAHFTIIAKRGKCLYGMPVKEVFADVPQQYYMDSIYNDVADAAEDIVENTMYLTLNLPRVLAYQKEGLVLSKKEGGLWALHNIPREFHSLILGALGEYEHDLEIGYDMVLARRFAQYMLQQIRHGE